MRKSAKSVRNKRIKFETPGADPGFHVVAKLQIHSTNGGDSYPGYGNMPQVKKRNRARVSRAAKKKKYARSRRIKASDFEIGYGRDALYRYVLNICKQAKSDAEILGLASKFTQGDVFRQLTFKYAASDTVKFNVEKEKDELILWIESEFFTRCVEHLGQDCDKFRSMLYDLMDGGVNGKT